MSYNTATNNNLNHNNQTNNNVIERYLMNHFVIHTLAPKYQHIAKHYVFHRANSTQAVIPDSGSLTNNDGTTNFVSLFGYLWNYFCMLLLFAHYGFAIFYIFYYESILVQANIDIWAMCLCFALIEYYVVMESVVIWLKEVVVVNQLIGSVVYAQYMKIQKRARLILRRSSGILTSSNSLVQHFNPACRIARNYAYLPVARLVLLCSDVDLIEPIYPKYTYLYTLGRAKVGVSGDRSFKYTDPTREEKNDFTLENAKRELYGFPPLEAKGGFANHINNESYKTSASRQESFIQHNLPKVATTQLRPIGVLYFIVMKCYEVVVTIVSSMMILLLAVLPFVVVEWILDVLALIPVNGVIFGLYFLAKYNFIAGVAVAAVLVAIPVLTTFYYWWTTVSVSVTQYNRDSQQSASGGEVADLFSSKSQFEMSNVMRDKQSGGGGSVNMNGSFYGSNDDVSHEGMDLKMNTYRNAGVPKNFVLGSQLDTFSLASQQQLSVARRQGSSTLNSKKGNKSRVLGPPISGFRDKTSLTQNMNQRYEAAFGVNNTAEGLYEQEQQMNVNNYLSDDNVSLEGSQMFMQPTRNNNFNQFNNSFSESKYDNMDFPMVQYTPQQLRQMVNVQRSTANNNNTIVMNSQQQYLNAEQYKLSNTSPSDAFKSFNPNHGASFFHRFNRPQQQNVHQTQSGENSPEYGEPVYTSSPDAAGQFRGSMLENEGQNEIGDQQNAGNDSNNLNANDLSYLTASEEGRPRTADAGDEAQDHNFNVELLDANLVDDNDYDSVISAPEKSQRIHHNSNDNSLTRGRKNKPAATSTAPVPTMFDRLKRQFTGTFGGSSMKNTTGNVVVTPNRNNNLNGGSSQVIVGNYNLPTVKKEQKEPSLEIAPVEADKSKLSPQPVQLTRPNAPIQPTASTQPAQYFSNRQKRRMHRRTPSGKILKGEVRESGPGAESLQYHQQVKKRSEQKQAENEQPHSADDAAPKPQQYTAPSDFTIVASDQVLPVVNILANLELQMQQQIRQSGGAEVQYADSNGIPLRTSDGQIPPATPMNTQLLNLESQRQQRRSRSNQRVRVINNNASFNPSTSGVRTVSGRQQSPYNLLGRQSPSKKG